MKKTLTVSVAAYNVEKFIRNTLESCIQEDIMDDLEVLIIDDGATDKTSEIAQEYQERYPQTFRLIRKANGGYGTTVNRSMQEASGRYFRLLDGDDWFDKQGLRRLVKHLRNTDVDAVFTQMYLCYPDHQVKEDDTWKRFIGKTFRLRDIPAGVFAGMWEFTVKTELLRDHPFELPCKTFYTDHLFLMYPIPYIKEVTYLGFPVYCYRVGYEEQSISAASRLKHVDEILKVSRLASEYYFSACQASENRAYALERARFCHMEAFRTLLLLPPSRATMNKIKSFDKSIAKAGDDIIVATEGGIGSKAIKLLRKTNYWGYFLVKFKYYLRKKVFKRCKS